MASSYDLALQDLATDPSYLPAEEALGARNEKVQELQTTYGPQGFDFQVDGSGHLSISNTPQTRAAAGLTSPSKEQVNTSTNFNLSIQQLLQTEDPSQRAVMMAGLQTQFAEFQAKTFQELTTAAEQRVGVTQLESLLAQNEAADRSHPMWGQFMSDSKQTSEVRQALNQARIRADGEAKDMLASNVGLASMRAQLGAASEVYKRLDLKQGRLDEFEQRKDFEKEFKLETLMQEMGPEVLSRMAIIDPSVNGRPAEEVALRASRAFKDSETKLALERPTEELPLLAFIGENEAAARVLAAKEAQRTGKSVEETSRELLEFKAMMGAPIPVMRQKFAALGIPPKEWEKISTQLSVGITGGTKEEVLQAKKARFDLTQRLYTKIAEDKFLTNVQGWGLIDPEMKQAVDSTLASRGKANAVDVLNAYVGTAKGLDALAKQNKFFQVMEETAKAKNQSFLTPINPFDMRVRIQESIIKNKVFNNVFLQSTYENPFSTL